MSDGLGQLSGGALELDNGAGQILDGQKALRDGLLQLEAGVKTLPDSVRTQLATNASYQALLGGMQAVVDGIGKPTDVTNPATGQPATLFGGLNAIRGGLATQVKPGLQRRDRRHSGKRAEAALCASILLSYLAAAGCDVGSGDRIAACLSPACVPATRRRRSPGTARSMASLSKRRDGADRKRRQTSTPSQAGLEPGRRRRSTTSSCRPSTR